MIRFSQVHKRYANGFEALKGITFHIEPGELIMLTGHSGAGKSTLLKLVLLVERATRGQVIVNEQNLVKLPARRTPQHRRQVGVVFQDHKLLYDRTVFDNIALPLVVAGVGHREIARRVRAALDKVSLLGKESLFPIMLSGGEQQRVGIARAIANRPPILLADEPTGNLDPQLADEIMDLFVALNRHNTTVVVATHDLRHIERTGARLLELQSGRLVHDQAALS
ncbi:MAG: cell division ATP-binding protein FtsE [Gammaproteobacteria bacterium]|nr:cell division ATP-binding protein FtsE [Gammaproteobacteria bacterium]